MNDPIDPPHYRAGDYDLIDVLEAFGLDKNYGRANAVKYLFRADRKGQKLTDLKKARWHINREIDRLEAKTIMPDNDGMIHVLGCGSFKDRGREYGRARPSSGGC